MAAILNNVECNRACEKNVVYPSNVNSRREKFKQLSVLNNQHQDEKSNRKSQLAYINKNKM